MKEIGILWLLAMASAFGQMGGIDPTLFGDTIGGAIPDAPDMGEGAWISRVEPPAPKRAIVKPKVAAPVKEATRVPNIDEKKPIRKATKKNAKSAVKAAPKEKKSWLPWRKKRDAPKTIDPRLKPRMSEAKTQSRVGGDSSGEATGLTQGELARWQRDPRKAMKKARVNRRMLLLWMTDSKRTSTSRILAGEVLRHTRFLRMAKDSIELTRVDFAEHEIASHPYTKRLKEKLNISGFPVLILFKPDGREAWRYVGYRSNRYPEVISQLQNQVRLFKLNEKDHRKRLVDDGFRTWTNHLEQPIFAKVLSLSRKDKTVLFVNEYGEKYSYQVLKLSAGDRDRLSKQFPKPTL